MFKNMKIRKRLIITFILIAAVSNIGGIVGLTVISNLIGQYSHALTYYGFAQGDLGHFNTEFKNRQILLRDLIINTDDKTKQSYKDQLDSSIIKCNDYLAKMKSEMVTSNEKKYYDEIVSYRDRFLMAEKNASQLALLNMNSEAYQFVETQVAPNAEKIRNNINALINEKTTNGNQISADLAVRSVSTKGMVIAIILVSMLFSVFIAFLIARSISRPVEEMAQAAKKMAQGDLNIQVESHSNDEIGQLGQALSGMILSIRSYIEDIRVNLAKISKGDLTVTTDMDYQGDFVALKDSIDGIVLSLNDVMMQINMAAGQVATSSQQVSAGSQALAQGAAEQAESIEELSTSINGISKHTQNTAEHAVSATGNVDKVNSEIESCNSDMKEMVQEMSRIQDASHQIEKIIKTIEDIAFQTNILALNAAVEAARAGTAGKGFAVVADEVRNLAGRSSEAVKETTVLIRKSIDEVQSGSKIMEATASSLQRVVETAQSVAETVTRISEASEKQSEAILQVNAGVGQISSVVQNNSATAEQSAAASEELSGQAQLLKELVNKFRLKLEKTENSEESAQLTETDSKDVAKYDGDKDSLEGIASEQDESDKSSYSKYKLDNV